MTNPLDINATLRARMRRRESLVGSFVKTPHPLAVEVMSGVGLDFLVLDAEHAPFDRAAIDACILAGLAWGCPVMVRVPVAEPDWIMHALDCGAAGLFVPHVADKAAAQRLAALASFAPNGKRGFSPSVRAGNYGRRGLRRHLQAAREDFALVCQIEEPAAIDAAAGIAAVEGVDAVFIGPADLAVAAGLDDMAHPDAVMLCERGLKAAHGQAAAAIYVSDLAEARRWRQAGASIFLVGSDHTFLLAGAGARLAMDERASAAPF